MICSATLIFYSANRRVLCVVKRSVAAKNANLRTCPFPKKTKVYRWSAWVLVQIETVLSWLTAVFDELAAFRDRIFAKVGERPHAHQEKVNWATFSCA